MNQPSPLDAAYAAGFFDGEGTVHVGEQKVQVVFTNTDLPVLRWLRDRWSGKLYKHSESGSFYSTLQRYILCLTKAHEQETFLLAIQPHLVVKSALSANALEYFATKARAARRGTKFDGHPFAQKHRELRAAIYGADLPVEEALVRNELVEQGILTLDALGIEIK